MVRIPAKLFRPWQWGWRAWVVLLVMLAGGVWGGRHAWAWQQRRAGALALERYQTAAAREHLSACLAIWPSDVQALLLASRAARRTGRFDEAEEYLRAAERSAPHSSEAAFEWSLQRAATGEIDDQLEEFLQQQVQRDLSLVALVGEALTEGYARRHRIYEAFLCVDRWLKVQPDNLQALYLRGRLHSQTRKLHKGVPDFQRVVDLDPTRADARRLLALGLMESGRYAEALVHLEELQRKAPDDPQIVVQQARAYHGLQQSQQARRLLDGVLTDHPDLAAALRARGEIELADQPALAETYLRRAAAASPHDYQIRFALLRSLVQQGKAKEEQAKALRREVDELKELWERLGEITSSKLSMRPNDVALYVELASLYRQLGQPDNSLRWLLHALQKDAEYRPAHAALAEHYEQAGNAEAAAHHRQLAGP